MNLYQKYFQYLAKKNAISLKYISSQNPQKDILKKCKKNEIIFFVKPVKFKKIKDIAEQHKHLPPKSTYILPKLRSGLVLYKFK